jgi:hypothetical protein
MADAGVPMQVLEIIRDPRFTIFTFAARRGFVITETGLYSISYDLNGDTQSVLLANHVLGMNNQRQIVVCADGNLPHGYDVIAHSTAQLSDNCMFIEKVIDNIGKMHACLLARRVRSLSSQMSPKTETYHFHPTCAVRLEYPDDDDGDDDDDGEDDDDDDDGWEPEVDDEVWSDAIAILRERVERLEADLQQARGVAPPSPSGEMCAIC